MDESNRKDGKGWDTNLTEVLETFKSISSRVSIQVSGLDLGSSEEKMNTPLLIPKEHKKMSRSVR